MKRRSDILAIHFRDAQKQWRWRIVDAVNGQVLDQSSQGYSRKIDMRATFRKLFPGVAWQVEP